MKPLESLVRVFVELHPEDAARAFETLDPAQGVRLVKELPDRLAVGLLQRLSAHVAGQVVNQLTAERIAQLVGEMTPRDGCTLLNHLSDDVRESVMAKLAPATAARLHELAGYPAQTAGALMEPRVASLSIDLSVTQAISQIRKAPREALLYLYVTGRDGKLIGVLTMRDLLLAAPRDPIEGLVKRNIVTVPATMESQEVVSLMRERGFLALPVVDFEGRLVGVVKHDEALEASQLEAFEDLAKLVGAGADERALSPVSTVVRSRLPWLYVNLVTAFMAAAVVGIFEETISDIAVLAVLLPVVAGQGGNTGCQSLAVVMRGLALREIIPGVKTRVVMKELLGGLINGISIAIVTAVVVVGWRLAKGESLTFCLALAAVIGMAMVVNMVAAALAGAVIPLALRALGRDPAQSSSIFLTTVTDIVGFASFLGFAVLFKGLLLPPA